jgi:hypothetical protein
MTQNNQTNKPQTAQKPVTKRPDETGAINVEGFIKIFDPVNQEVFVEKRA